MATSQSSGKGGKGGHASPATHDEDEDLKVRRGRHFRAWVDARKKKRPNIAPADMGFHYPNSPQPPKR